ncbi:MAG: hypothetical protein U1F55_12175 [Chitinivorax sp.]
MENTPIARVALDVPLPGLFDYLAPGITAADIGCRVVVPFGRRTLAGVLLEVASSSEHDLGALKQLGAVLRDMPALPPDILALCRFCSAYYQHPLGPSIFTGLPVLLRRVSEFVEARPAGWQLTETGREALPSQVSRRAKVQWHCWRCRRRSSVLLKASLPRLALPHARPCRGGRSSNG